MSTKRKNSFNPDWENDYEFVKRSRKGESYFYCSICQKDCNVELMGVSAITAHQNCKAHKQIVEERRKSSTMAQFVVNKSVPTAIELKIAAAEGFIFNLNFINQFQPVYRFVGIPRCTLSFFCIDRLCFVAFQNNFN